MTTKERYSGIQTVFERAHDGACLFLSLLSIAEETIHKPIDFITAYNVALKYKCIKKDFTVSNSPLLLHLLTGKEWSRTKETTLPIIRNNDFTVAIYKNDNTGYTHFRRRGYDTLENSKTVKEGYLEGYYVYSYKEEV